MKITERAFLLKHIFQNWISYYTGISNPVPVGYVIIGVTYKCNSRCGMCGIWKMYDEKPALYNDEIFGKFLLKRVKESRIISKVKTIDITGGEPFLRNDIDLILKEIFNIKNINMLTINTNGITSAKILKDTEDVLKNISPYKIFSISVSIDGPQLIHEKIRGIPGCFSKIRETIKGLNNLKKSFPNLNIRSNAVIQKENINYIDDIINFWNDNCIEGSFSIAHDNLYTHTLNLDDIIMNFNDLEIAIMKKALPESRGMNHYIEDKFTRPLHCFAGFSAMFIDAFGDVYPCNYLGGDKSYSMGNIKKNKIDEIWTSSEAKRIRAKIKKCPYVHCWDGCEVAQTLIQYNAIDVLLKKISFNLLGFYKLKGLGEFK